MKKHIIFTGALLLASALTGEAMADCTNNQVTDIGNRLLSNTACSATGQGTQEEHYGSITGGDLWDYKTGNVSHPVDPRRKLGTWSSNGTTVTYTYDAFGSATSGPYTVFSTGGSNYDFCSGSTVVASITVKSGTNVGCH